MKNLTKYSPELAEDEIKETRLTAKARRDLYKSKGLDFLENRKFMLDKAGDLSGKILEIGSGRGNTALCLARAGYNFTSIDVEPEMLRYTALNLAAERLFGKAELFLMDGCNLAFEDNSFENIIMVEALHHINDADGLFNEIDRVLRSRGKLVFSDFNKRGTEIIEEIHGNEGHTHESSGVGVKETISWFKSRGYFIKNWEDKCHWVVVGVKP